MAFKLTSQYSPTGDQPKAIAQLVKGIEAGESDQILLGVTGSGKTFTMANVIAQVHKPTLVLSHNKTLAAQLYGEFKNFFPENAVEYFISYYDYYQPEAYIASSNTYIEKDLSINEEIEKLRLAATSQLLTGRRDVIVVASVSCIYGIGNPEEFGKNIVKISVGEQVSRNKLLYAFVEILYSRTTGEFKRGTFRVSGDTVDVFPAYADFAYRLLFWGDDIEAIHRIEPETGRKINDEKHIVLYPANLFVTGKEALNNAIIEIQNDLVQQIKMFEIEGKYLEAKRIKERTEFDMEMMREIGYCSGIENYSRYFDRRLPGTRPFCLLDYFPNDFLMIIDESHVTLPQIRAMWGGDRSRKTNLVDFGFRLPSALDNRPLTFSEFEELASQKVFVSATPADYELQLTSGAIVEQIIRPTGLLDPVIEVKPSTAQIDDLILEIHHRIQVKERVLVTTLTKRMAEELSKYLDRISIKCRYIHSEIKTLERVEILRELRLGVFDVLVGVNLLREGLDLPEVSLIAIMDADKEGFLRNERSLVQTIGRAARNVNGKVIMYADKITKSMAAAIDETSRRRSIQHQYNLDHDITPTTAIKSHEDYFSKSKGIDGVSTSKAYTGYDEDQTLAAEANVVYNNKNDLERAISKLQKEMEKAAKELNFMQAAQLRDQWLELNKQLKENY
ncbi:MAG: excinuclease ABC subunit UvrB [Cytophagales bacterium]|nr:MAG: excinuclease ABC subunit UvrB [Cytophagales bacterium]